MGKLIVEGNSVYEIDEACIKRKERQEKDQQAVQETQGRGQRPKRKWKGGMLSLIHISEPTRH